jgi:aspartyl-tRNA(Asn)/glutamyl-tRNA(Gln) amidotransferase subunit C
MSQFDRQKLEELERLCRISCTEDEKKELEHHLDRMLDFIEQLNEIDTDKTEPCNYILKEMQRNVMRDDIIGDMLEREELLSNAPDKIGGMIKVPTVIK